MGRRKTRPGLGLFIGSTSTNIRRNEDGSVPGCLSHRGRGSADALPPVGKVTACSLPECMPASAVFTPEELDERLAKYRVLCGQQRPLNATGLQNVAIPPAVLQLLVADMAAERLRREAIYWAKRHRAPKKG